MRRISSRVTSDRRESPRPLIERIRNFIGKNCGSGSWHFPLPKRPGKLEMDNQPDLADPKT